MPSGLSADFFLRYLLLPILALVWATGLVLLNYKRGLLGIRPLLLLLLFTLPMALAGLFGLIDLWFVPGYYLGMAGAFLGLGVLYVRELEQVLGADRQAQPLFVHLLTELILLVGGYLFSLVFNLFSSLGYGLWAATCVLPFYVPLFFGQTFEALVSIPDQIRQVWYYPLAAPEIVLDEVNPYHLMIAAVELHKRPGSGAPMRIKARLPQDMPFGTWFQKFIDDYNYTFAAEPIEITNAAAQQYGWLFYAVRPPFRRRQYIDADRSIAENRLTERCLIVAKRVTSV